MSTPEKLLNDLRARKDEPIIQRLMLADIERDLGEGFAKALRAQLDAEPQKKRRK